MYKCILFDFDGTVFDTLEGIANCVQYSLKKFGIDAPLSELKCFAGPPLDAMFTEKYGFSSEQAALAVGYFREHYLPVGVYESRVFPGIKELLTSLREKGYKLGLSSLKPLSLVRELLEREHMLDSFDAVYGSQPELGLNEKWLIINRAMETLDVTSEETVLVGDTKYDIEGAHRCGIKCIGVEYGYGAGGELELFGADYIVSTISELSDFFIKQ